MTQHPLFLVISAPSGGGKTTVIQGLLACESNLRRVVTCTTRLPRSNEREDVDYHFLTLQDFDQRVAAGDFLEYARVYDQAYGTLRASVLGLLRSGMDVVLSLDVQGVATLQTEAVSHPELLAAMTTVFLTPPSIRELEHRLRARAADSEPSIQRRLREASHEIAQWKKFDYLIVSESRDEDLRRMRAVLQSERLRSRRQQLDFQ